MGFDELMPKFHEGQIVRIRPHNTRTRCRQRTRATVEKRNVALAGEPPDFRFVAVCQICGMVDGADYSWSI